MTAPPTPGRMSEGLDELERRVGEKFVAKASERVSDWSGLDDPFDVGSWLQTAAGSPPSVGTTQFPREQWASYPAKRTVALMTLDHLLDFELTDEQWMTACMVWWYGGKTRLA